MDEEVFFCVLLIENMFCLAIFRETHFATWVPDFVEYRRVRVPVFSYYL
jgi:hypothetical protein